MTTIIKATDRNRGVHGVAFNFDDMGQRAEGYLDKVRSQAAEIIATAQREAELLRSKAEEEGRIAGRKDAEKTIVTQLDRQLKNSIPALHQVAEQIRDAKQAWLDHWEKSAVHTACAIAERLIRRELIKAPEIPLELVRESLELAAGSSHVRIHLNPTDRKTLLPRIQSILDELCSLGEVEIIAEESISAGGCRIETEFGTIDQQWESQLARIEEELT